MLQILHYLLVSEHAPPVFKEGSVNSSSAWPLLPTLKRFLCVSGRQYSAVTSSRKPIILCPIVNVASPYLLILPSHAIKCYCGSYALRVLVLARCPACMLFEVRGTILCLTDLCIFYRTKQNTFNSRRRKRICWN